ncbi:MAG: hypothetical protein HYY22_01540 [Thaumarchaeota archaeon]|nr:hypothetical protein [Nitrososphaerota archaeon]
MFELDNKRRGEDFTISSASVSPTDDLTVTVVNGGGSTAHIVGLWVINESVTPNTHSRYDVNVFIPSGGAGVVSGTAPYGSRLTLRLISELGSRVSYRIAPASEIPNLRMTIDASPPTVIGSHDVGITLLVFNDNTQYNALYDLKIDAVVINKNSTDDINYTYSGTGENITLTPPSIANIASIRSGETVAFTWKYTIIDAGPGETFTFKGRYTGALTFATETVEVVTPFGRNQEEAINEVLGSLRIQISSFRWSQDNGVNWSTGFSVPSNTNTVWKVEATNTHLTKTIWLDEGSALSLMNTDTGTVKIFYIIEYPKLPPPQGRVYQYNGVNSDGNDGTADPVEIAPGQTVTLYFGATSSGGQNQQSTGVSGTWASFIALIGTYNDDPDDPFGQSIPFIAVNIP